MLKNNLELIVGPVCSGKSAELIRRIDRYSIAGFNLLVVKPKLDTRSKIIQSRNGSKVNCIELSNINNIFDELIKLANNSNDSLKLNTIDIIAFDEAQFFKDTYSVIKELLNLGYKVLVSALDTDFYGEPFGDIVKLVTLSDDVKKMTSVCMSCKSDNAIFSQKLKVGGSQIEVGDLELYHPRCINCFVPGGVTDGLDNSQRGMLF
jgi:thymidine kinase